jgi:hypothetical protein
MKAITGRRLTAAFGIVLLCGLLIGGTARAQDSSDQPAELLAGQVRQQGLSCDKAVSAQRDPTLSKPEEPVWILVCSNASYRITVRADMQAQIEPLAGTSP